jgi:hypothetical protein
MRKAPRGRLRQRRAASASMEKGRITQSGPLWAHVFRAIYQLSHKGRYMLSLYDLICDDFVIPGCLRKGATLPPICCDAGEGASPRTSIGTSRQDASTRGAAAALRRALLHRLKCAQPHRVSDPVHTGCRSTTTRLPDRHADGVRPSCWMPSTVRESHNRGEGN